MNALRKPDPCACPYCGQAMDGDDAPFRALRLPPKRRAVLDALRGAEGRVLSSRQLEDAVWGDDPNGGPDSASSVLYHHVSKLRGELRPLGFGIENSHGLGYRLVRSEAAR